MTKTRDRRLEFSRIEVRVSACACITTSRMQSRQDEELASGLRCASADRWVTAPTCGRHRYFGLVDHSAAHQCCLLCGERAAPHGWVINRAPDRALAARQCCHPGRHRISPRPQPWGQAGRWRWRQPSCCRVALQEGPEDIRHSRAPIFGLFDHPAGSCAPFHPVEAARAHSWSRDRALWISRAGSYGCSVDRLTVRPSLARVGNDRERQPGWFGGADDLGPRICSHGTGRARPGAAWLAREAQGRKAEGQAERKRKRKGKRRPKRKRKLPRRSDRPGHGSRRSAPH